MIGSSFKKPTVRENLGRIVSNLPKKISKGFLLELVQDKKLIVVGDDYKEAVKRTDELRADQGLYFPKEFVINGSDSNYGLKSLEYLLKIDSEEVLNVIKPGAKRLTRELLEECAIWPSRLIGIAVKKQRDKDPKIKNPPLGFYWMGFDDHVRATTWLRCITGYEMKKMKDMNNFEILLDGKPYADNMGAKVKSRRNMKKWDVNWMKLPVNKFGDRRQYSDWPDMCANSNDPDAKYKGEEHDKFRFPVYFFSATTVAAFHEIKDYFKGNVDGKKFRINPFPIPYKHVSDYVDRLRLRAIIENEKGSISVLNKSTIDRQIGAKNMLQTPRICFYHWGEGI